ncbi:MAG: YciI family protein [Pyrinomonadaceae bacterium]
MAQYMLLLVEEPPDFSKFSPEGIQQLIAEYKNWRNRVAESGKLAGGAKLCDEGGKYLSGTGDDFRVTDGPFAEAKEILGGYFMIEAANYDEAVELARDCPHLKYGTRIEIREVQPT